MSTRNATAPLDSSATQAAAAAALTAYDPPTRAEATADKGEVMARLGTPVNASLADDIGSIKDDTNAISLSTGFTLPDLLAEMRGSTFNPATDSLEAIRDRGDAAWTTGAGGSAPTAGEIADAVWDELQSGHVTIGSFGEIATEISDLAARLTAARAGYLDKLNVGTGTLAHTGNAGAFQADVSGLATSASLATVETAVGAIKDKTDALPADPAGVSDLPAAAPTVVEIDAQLSATHGAGSWEGAGAAAPTVEEIDAHLTANHGSGSWASGSAGSGARTVAIVVDDGTTPIEGAKVRLTNGLESYLQTTDATGTATFSLDDATWAVAVTKPGRTFAGASLVVGGDLAATYSMGLAAVPPPPADLSLCRVYLDAEDVLDRPAAGLEIRFQLVGGPARSERMLDVATSAVLTLDAAGHGEIDLQRNDLLTPSSTVYAVTCRELGLVGRRVTLAAPVVNLADLIG